MNEIKTAWDLIGEEIAAKGEEEGAAATTA